MTTERIDRSLADVMRSHREQAGTRSAKAGSDPMMEPWVSPGPHSDIRACQLCYRIVFGAEQADLAAEELARQRRRAA
jgi:hypothetical protein